MLAEAPIKVPLPPKQAPKARAQARGRIEIPSTFSTICIITGTIVAVKGMLSTNAWRTCRYYRHDTLANRKASVGILRTVECRRREGMEGRDASPKKCPTPTL